MTCSSSPRARSRAARRSSGWPEATARRRSWRRSPHDTTSPTSASRRGRATTSRSTSASIATTSWARWTRSPTASSGVSTSHAVNDRVFVNNASLGVYAKVVQSDAYRDAKLETWTRHAARPAGPRRRADRSRVHRARREQLRRRAARARIEQPLSADAAWPAPARASGSTRACSASWPRGCAAPPTCRSSSRSSWPARWAASPACCRGRRRSSRSAPARPVEVGLDGEALVLDPPLRFSVAARGAARAPAPRQWACAPAARAVALTTDNLGALLRVAAGR